jgi:CHASE2 domain-containing sensor protein
MRIDNDDKLFFSIVLAIVAAIWAVASLCAAIPVGLWWKPPLEATVAILVVVFGSEVFYRVMGGKLNE